MQYLCCCHEFQQLASISLYHTVVWVAHHFSKGERCYYIIVGDDLIYALEKRENKREGRMRKKITTCPLDFGLTFLGLILVLCFSAIAPQRPREEEGKKKSGGAGRIEGQALVSHFTNSFQPTLENSMLHLFHLLHSFK